MLAVSGLASPASKPYRCLLPSLHLACQHFPLISCQHCLADLCSTSYPPSGLGGLQGGMPVASLWKQTCPSVGQKPWLQGTQYKQVGAKSRD